MTSETKNTNPINNTNSNNEDSNDLDDPTPSLDGGPGASSPSTHLPGNSCFNYILSTQLLWPDGLHIEEAENIKIKIQNVLAQNGATYVSQIFSPELNQGILSFVVQFTHEEKCLREEIEVQLSAEYSEFGELSLKSTPRQFTIGQDIAEQISQNPSSPLLVKTSYNDLGALQLCPLVNGQANCQNAAAVETAEDPVELVRQEPVEVPVNYRNSCYQNKSCPMVFEQYIRWIAQICDPEYSRFPVPVVDKMRVYHFITGYEQSENIDEKRQVILAINQILNSRGIWSDAFNFSHFQNLERIKRHLQLQINFNGLP